MLKKVTIVICSFFILFFIYKCQNDNKIIITKNYIYNSHWDESRYLTISISKLILNKNILNKDLESLQGFEIYNFSKVDTSFIFEGFKKNNVLKKIYFTEKNDDLLWRKSNNLDSEFSILGALKPNTWYRFDNLHEKWIYYVYIDKNEVSHIFAVNPTNI